MKIQLIRNTAISGFHVEVGDCIDVDNLEGMRLIRMKKAVEVQESLNQPKKRGRPKKDTTEIEATNE